MIINITEKGIPRGLLASAATFIRQKIRCRRKGIRYGWSLFQANGEALAYVISRLGEGKIVANIDAEFTLESVIEAYEYLEAGRASGKVMIAVS